MQIEEWQGAIASSIEQHATPYLVKLRGLDYVMFPETFNPNYAKASLLLLDNLGVRPGDTVLDPFTGSGADAIFAVLQGAARAVAIDKFTMPVLCARYNAYRLGLEDRVDVRQGDLFDALRPGERFDLIVANPPFRPIDPHSNVEAMMRDSAHATLRRFFAEVGDHLNPGGRMRIVFSNAGNVDHFHQLLQEQGYVAAALARARYAADVTMEVYEVTRARVAVDREPAGLLQAEAG
ncbi:MAG: methyltransferase [Candidatus Rokuibacteriota bacterium]